MRRVKAMRQQLNEDYKSIRRMTMRNKVLALPLFLIMATGISWAGDAPMDAQTTAKIQSRLEHAKVMKHGDVQVTYSNGVASLSGTVDNLGSKLDAEKAARKTDGVTSVVDNIQVRDDTATEARILEKARQEIVTYYAYGIFDNITLQANGDRLIVAGQVTMPFKKDDIGRMLARVKGVAALDNNLEVLPLSSFDDGLRIQVARAIYGDPYFVHYRIQALPPIHIVVKNGQVTLEGAVATNLDRTKADMAARSAGLSFSVTDNLRVANVSS
jgi:hyperosmotically inducible periplasmic protein